MQKMAYWNCKGIIFFVFYQKAERKQNWRLYGFVDGVKIVLEVELIRFEIFGEVMPW